MWKLCTFGPDRINFLGFFAVRVRTTLPCRFVIPPKRPIAVVPNFTISALPVGLFAPIHADHKLAASRALAYTVDFGDRAASNPRNLGASAPNTWLTAPNELTYQPLCT